MSEQEKDLSNVDFGAGDVGSSVANPKLSQREQLIAILRSGQTTMHKGRHIRTISDVPTDAELALSNPGTAAATEAMLEAQITQAQAQLKQIQSAKAVEEKSAPSEKAEAKATAKE